jgi:hypothetical protein
VLLSVVGSVRAEHSKPYSKRGALLYRVGLPDKLRAVPNLSGLRVNQELSCLGGFGEPSSSCSVDQRGDVKPASQIVALLISLI